MTDFDNTNSGALFKNDKDGNENRPDYKGSLNVNGVDYWISSWVKTSKKGDKYMSLSVQNKEDVHKKGMVQATQAAATAPRDEPPAETFDDDIPF